MRSEELVEIIHVDSALLAQLDPAGKVVTGDAPYAQKELSRQLAELGPMLNLSQTAVVFCVMNQDIHTTVPAVKFIGGIDLPPSLLKNHILWITRKVR